MAFLNLLARYWWWTFLLGLLGLTGCVVELHGNGEVGFKQATTWSFYHATQIEDEKQVSKSELTSQPLLDYLAKPQDEAGPPAPTP